MSNSSSSYPRRSYTIASSKLDYREKLKQPSKSDVLTTNQDKSAVEHTSQQPAKRVRDVAEEKELDSCAAQSILVAALQVLRRAIRCERQAAEASISLAQGKKLKGMIAALEDTDSALRETLTVQGAKMFNLTTDSEPAAEDDEPSWWFALTEVLQTLEDDIDWITSLVARQPKGSAGRTISGVVVRLLHRHYNNMLVEANRWMG